MAFKTKISLSEEKREALNTLLNEQLARTFDLFSITKQAHWNVKGMRFFQLHELFDNLAAEMPDFVDELAERVTTLGGIAQGSIKQAAERSDLEPLPDTFESGRDCVEKVTERFAATANAMRLAIERADEIGDEVTVDLLTEITRKLDKSIYFLQAHLQGD